MYDILQSQKHSIRTITNEILRCNQLKTFLYGNANAIIETQIESLSTVQLLNNEFEFIDTKSFHGLKNLVEICLSNNKLQSLEGQFFADQANLTHLT